MCSPVGHSLAALVVGTAANGNRLSLKYLVFCVFSGCAADLDFLIGWYLGDLNGYHHLGSHSLFAVIMYGLFVYGAVGIFNRYQKADNSLLVHGSIAYGSIRWPVAGALMYLSHIVLDWLAEDNSEPVGLQILWPLSDQFMASPVFLFPRFIHDAEGADIVGMFAGLFNWHNFSAVIVETIIFLPVLLLILWKRKSTHSGESMG